MQNIDDGGQHVGFEDVASVGRMPSASQLPCLGTQRDTFEWYD